MNNKPDKPSSPFTTNLGYIKEEPGQVRSIYRSNDKSPLLRVTQGQTLLSSQNGVNLSNIQQLLIKHNKYLEAVISLAILDRPGGIREDLDKLSETLARVLFSICNSTLISKFPVFFQGKKSTLLQVFTTTTFNPMDFPSDQIGRKMTSEGDVKTWLLNKLREHLNNNNYLLFLTKVKAISSFGTTLWQLLTIGAEQRIQNIAAVTALLSSAGCLSDVHAERLMQRFEEFKVKTRSPQFDDAITRARSERMPLHNNKPIEGIYSDASIHGLGFGQVVQNAMTEEETNILTKMLSGSGSKNSQINAIQRQNAPIDDASRPFMLSSDEFTNMPDFYRNMGLFEAINNHRLNHGVGINRWQPYGIYGMDTNKSGYPSAGAQSGGTTDIILASIMLNLNQSNSLYGNKETVLRMTLAAAAFMNFGGYHTFSEVLPIGESVARNEIFVPGYAAATFRIRPIYKQMVAIYTQYGDPAYAQQIRVYEQRHWRLTQNERRENNYMPPDQFSPLYSTIFEKS